MVSHLANEHVIARIVDDSIRCGGTVRSLANGRPGAAEQADVVLRDLGPGAIEALSDHEVSVAAGHSARDVYDTLARGGREVPGLPRTDLPIGAAATAGLHAAGLATPPLSDAVRSWTGVLVERGRSVVVTLLRGRDDVVLDAVLSGHGRLGIATRVGLRTRPVQLVAPRVSTEPWAALRVDLLLHAAHRDRVRLRITSDHPERVERRVGPVAPALAGVAPWVVPVLVAGAAIDALRASAAPPWQLDVCFVGSSRVAASPFAVPSAVLRLTGGGDRRRLDTRIQDVVGEGLAACPVGVIDLPVARFCGLSGATRGARAGTWRDLAHPVFAEPLGDAIKQLLLPEA